MAFTGKIILDGDVAKIVDFMQRELPADRLRYVSGQLPLVASLIWQENRCTYFEQQPIRGTQSTANESAPAERCVDGDSAAVRDKAAPR
jgi:hypothetical protein